MSYHRILGFEKEAFSTSPDPDFFYLSPEHDKALTNILIELHLQRGLSAVFGDVGTGKTTLSRKLVQELESREDCIFHIILDPSFESREFFLKSLVKNFGVMTEEAARVASMTDMREEFERFLFQKGVIEHKTVVLIIDEAQCLDRMSLEVLRLLLNYETNEFKLLQLVLLGQMELLPIVQSINNFMDRISFKTRLNPLSFNEMKEMIYFRIAQASGGAKVDYFSEDALNKIYQYTKGYPRQVTMMCHQAIKAMIMKSKLIVDRQIVEEIINDEVSIGWQKTDRLLRKSSY